MSHQFEIKIHNLVYTCFISAKINLDDIARRFKARGIAFDYNPKKFAAVFLRSIDSLVIPMPPEYRDSETMKELFYYRTPRTQSNKSIGNRAVLLFSGKKCDEGGRMVCTGVKVAAQARFILEKIEAILKDIGYSASIEKYEIQNLVATHNVGGEIDIKNLETSVSTFCTYDSERFPGAIMRHPELKPVTILIFKSGNLVITGAKHDSKVREALAKVYPILMRFTKGRGPMQRSQSVAYSEIEQDKINTFIEDFIVEEYT